MAAATSISIASALDALHIKCAGGCGNVPYEPKLLACLHTICLRCGVNSAGDSSTIACPVCGEETRVPKGGADGLLSNVFLQDRLELAEILTTGTAHCRVCVDGIGAAMYCLECGKPLCKEHGATHSREAANRGHRVVTIANLRGAEFPQDFKPPAFCPSHPSEPVKYFCVSCGICTCRECALETHTRPEHQYIPIESAGQSAKDSIMSAIGKNGDRIQQLATAVDVVNATTRDLDVSAAAATDDINHTIDDLIALLNDRRQALLDEVEAIRVVKSRGLLAQRDALKTSHTYATDSLRFAENLVDEGSNVAVLALRDCVVACLSRQSQQQISLVPCEEDTLCLTVAPTVVAETIVSLGHIVGESSSTYPPSCFLSNVEQTDEEPIPGYIGEPITLIVQTRDRSGQSRSSGGDIIAGELRSTSSATVVNAIVRDLENGSYELTMIPSDVGLLSLRIRVKGVDIQGSPRSVRVDCRPRDYTTVTTSVCTFGSHGSTDGKLSSPFGVSVDPDGNFVVADRGNHRVCVFDRQGGFLHKFGGHGTEPGQFSSPYSVTVDRQGRVIVPDHGSTASIHVFDISGHFLFRFGGKGSAEGQFNNPYGCAVDLMGNIYVVDGGNSRIQVFSADGTFRTAWGSHGTGQGEFSSPYGVCIDSDGRVIVADGGNQRVQIFSAGAFAFVTSFGTIGSKNGQFFTPYGVCCDGSDNIIVADHGNQRVQVFDPRGTFISKFGSKGTGEGQFANTGSVCVDPRGLIAVADPSNHRIVLW